MLLETIEQNDGLSAWMAVLGIEILNEGGGLSVDDISQKWCRNSVNCWNILKPIRLQRGPQGRARMLENVVDIWTISSQASRKLVEGSTTKSYSLNLKRHGDEDSRAQSRRKSEDIVYRLVKANAIKRTNEEQCTYVARSKTPWIPWANREGKQGFELSNDGLPVGESNVRVLQTPTGTDQIGLSDLQDAYTQRTTNTNT